MKSLIKWILFVPVCLLSVALMLFVCVSPQTVTGQFATDINGIAEIIAFGILGLFAACFIVSLFDRNSSPIYVLSKNPIAGISGMLAAFAMAASAALSVAGMVQDAVFGVLDIVTVVFTGLAAIALLFVSLNHLTGSNTHKGVSVLFLTLPLWCGVHLIDRFMKHTAMPVAAAETLDLILFVALAMFFVYAMMIHAMIPSKGTVKNAVSFGFPAAVISFVYCISELFSVLGSETFAATDIIPAVSYGLIGIYVIAFTAELSSKAKSTYEQKVLDGEEEAVEDDADNEADEYSDEQDAVAVRVAQSEEVKEDDDDTSDDDVIEFTPAAATAVRVADEDDEDNEDDIAQELFDAAKLKDESSVTAFDVNNVESESDDIMIIDGENEINEIIDEAVPAPAKPTGATEREALVFDDDFILDVDGADSVDDITDDDDISAFILEKTTSDDATDASDRITSRLDEIDQLIISIQGGDTNDQKSE